MKELTDEMIAQAVREYEDARIAQIEKDMKDLPEHEFSQDFYRKMHEICPSIDPVTGQIRKPGQIWDEDTQRYI